MNDQDIKPINIRSKVKATDRYKKFLQVASIFLTKPLTPVEISIIDEFYHAENGNITTSSRKAVREILDMSAEQLNNYIRILKKEKGLIVNDSLHPMFLQVLPEGETMVINVQLGVVI